MARGSPVSLLPGQRLGAQAPCAEGLSGEGKGLGRGSCSSYRRDKLGGGLFCMAVAGGEVVSSVNHRGRVGFLGSAGGSRRGLALLWRWGGAHAAHKVEGGTPMAEG